MRACACACACACGCAVYQEGDIVVAIDQTKLDGLVLDAALMDAVRTLTVGPEGTSCTVQILRGDRCFHTYIHTHTCIHT